jgi:hypothetical protein
MICQSVKAEKLAGKRIIRLIACFCRLWAFETVQNALEKEENNAWTNGQSKRKETLMRAYQLATQVILILKIFLYPRSIVKTNLF